MEKPTEKYLQELIENTQKAFDNFSYDFSDMQNADITYVSTKTVNYMGIMEGIRELAEMKRYNIKEKSKINSNCKYYNKFYNVGGRLAKIECFVGGHNDLDVIYVAQYDGERRYLFPFFEDKSKAVGYPILVTNFENGKVTEEYRTYGNKIEYEKYDYSIQDEVEYYYVNFVPAGKYPIMGEEKGYFNKKSLEYHQENCEVWYKKQ